jgi:hypothetical protein
MAGLVNKLVVGGNLHDKTGISLVALTDNVPAAAGAAPTKAEFDALVDAYNAAATQCNAMVAVLVANGVLLSSS